jgi:DNA (cytosine-5)-methyltransferase 1
MKKIKVLNLYAGIGGNRKLWGNVDVTAVEINPEITKIYQGFFPDDKVILTDAHQYLLDHYKEFDFIWSSPPCPTHSTIRFMGTKVNEKFEKKYPDMRLYQEVIFLKHYAKCKWVVENVKPYYEPLIPAQEVGRHLFWSNFIIPKIKQPKNDGIKGFNNQELQDHKGFNINKYDLSFKGIRKDQILRNCVNSELGLHILQCAIKEKQEVLV